MLPAAAKRARKTKAKAAVPLLSASCQLSRADQADNALLPAACKALALRRARIHGMFDRANSTSRILDDWRTPVRSLSRERGGRQCSLWKGRLIHNQNCAQGVNNGKRIDRWMGRG